MEAKQKIDKRAAVLSAQVDGVMHFFGVSAVQAINDLEAALNTLRNRLDGGPLREAEQVEMAALERVRAKLATEAA